MAAHRLPPDDERDSAAQKVAEQDHGQSGYAGDHDDDDKMMMVMMMMVIMIKMTII